MTQTLLDIPEYLAVVSTPIGRIELVSDGESLTGIAIEDDGALPHDDLPRRTTGLIDEAVAQLGEYFVGDRTQFSVPFTLTGTAFQLAVWNALDLVPFGAVVSYASLGYTAVGSRGGRAIGRAVAANPLPIIVPSHRVVSSTGRITGFSGSNGRDIKAWLLDHEGADYAA
ncbi:methylated-DNA-[protein]-cysteine S-methyltransferase [Paramicrobacterium humi]|uniref:Methylated-DNA-[protein]-cysteine S-methyltransferase n=1 Tax=Paramicrobacterium humi TaxID=640635 RepID=A0A1H4PET5_9MICO|nr:methylated-DNA--[protein]-cysteine S-methyltransferase [Microbacterium humi]SEC05704.1 methylated-DNA-[protein]-cysteine S-methyltransferase [Microbacterium humi]